jgi:hypothetical protein
MSALEWMWKKGTLSQVELLFENLLGEIEENHEELQSA